MFDRMFDAQFPVSVNYERRVCQAAGGGSGFRGGYRSFPRARSRAARSSPARTRCRTRRTSSHNHTSVNIFRRPRPLDRAGPTPTPVQAVAVSPTAAAAALLGVSAAALAGVAYGRRPHARDAAPAAQSSHSDRVPRRHPTAVRAVAVSPAAAAAALLWRPRRHRPRPRRAARSSPARPREWSLHKSVRYRFQVMKDRE